MLQQNIKQMCQHGLKQFQATSMTVVGGSEAVQAKSLIRKICTTQNNTQRAFCTGYKGTMGIGGKTSQL